MKKRQGIFFTLWHTFRHYRIYIAVLVALGFLSAIFEGIGINAVVPLLSFLLGVESGPADFISKAIEGVFGFAHIPFTFRYLIAFILGLFILRAASMVAFGYVRGWISTDFFATESRDMQRLVLKASWRYLLGQKMGTLQNVLVRDLQRTTNLLEVISQAVQSFSGFLIYLLVAVNISPATTLAVMAGGSVLLLVVRPFLTRIQHTGEGIVDVEKQINKFLSEQIIGMKTLKAAGAEEAAISFGKALVNRLQALQIRLTLIKSLSTSLFQPFTVVFIAGVFAISYTSPGFSLISFIATLYLIQKMFTYLESGQGALHQISELAPYARSVSEYRQHLAHHSEEMHQGKQSFAFTGTLALKGVSLAYAPDNFVLRDIDLAVPQGYMVALIGPSGAGKTSLADLLLRLFEPTVGEITLDGVPAADISVSAWRQRMGYVSQDVFLFNGTVEENIRFFREDVSREAIESAAKQANILEFIQALPDGFNTTVGDRGMTLSGGQRQRIALARALAGNPAVLVLDEATSALDTESERLIQESIRSLHGKVTVLVIAHRLSTVENADEIVVLEQGRIIEQGSPQELLKNPDSYYSRHSRSYGISK